MWLKFGLKLNNPRNVWYKKCINKGVCANIYKNKREYKAFLFEIKK